MKTIRRQTDTIVAPATGFGRAALAIVRLSGPQTRFVIETMAGPLPPARRMCLRMLVDPANSQPLDRALVAFFPGPSSFTGEDLAEFYIHGGPAIVRALLRAVSSLENVRLAEPGEFTRRAVEAGKMDLTSAEALGDLIDAETDGQRLQALRQLDGALGRVVEAWREDLLGALALIEAELDFSDEGDVGEAVAADILGRLAPLARHIRSVLDDGGQGERMREGFTVVIAGPPNAGKSTLLNHLARRDVAIVSEIPGTTRDALEIRCDLAGYPVTLIDTAGLRRSTDRLENLGMDRTRHRIDGADLVLWLRPIDSETEGPAKDIDEASFDGPKRLHVWTKADLKCTAEKRVRLPSDACVVSALTGEGISSLLDAVRFALRGEISLQPALITRERHRAALVETLAALQHGLDSGPFLPLELLAEDVRLAAQALGRITGRFDVEDVLDRLFSTFCIGK